MNDSEPGRGPASTRQEAGAGQTNAALLIDFDNVTMGIRSDLQNQLRKLLNSEIIKSKVAVQRAYADWRRYPQYIVPLSEASIDLIFAPAFGSNKKNATDIRLAIDALELVFTRPEIGTYILLSGDSDFSSLVLKLKEYGKWVIGVGIRESASDLLVQNCDEYFSYAELTGLTREGEIEVMRRDPWELVVEAVLRMGQTGDVMRSDRLKQVMQQIDPHFDEKDAGFNRFSKFVLGAEQRGLLVLTKMEGGQYAIRIGPDANIPPEVDVPAPEADAGRAGRGRAQAPDDVGATGLTLASAFALLRKALEDLGAVGSESTTADQAREKTAELADAADDPIFEPKRFQRMLRQAHDAELIDLVKDGDGYLLRLHSEARDDDKLLEEKPVARTKRKRKSTTATKRRTRVAQQEAPDGEAAADGEDADKAGVVAAPARKKVKRTSTRKTKEKSPPASTTGDVAPEAATSSGPSPTVPADKPASSTRRSVRGRGSSRTRQPATPSAAQPPQGETTAEPSTEKPAMAPEKKPARRSGRRPADSRRSRTANGRASSVGGDASRAAKPQRKKAAESGTIGRRRAPTARRPAVRHDDSTASASVPARPVSRTAPSKPSEQRGGGVQTTTSPAPVGHDAASRAPTEGGIFKRMSAALQRVVRGEGADEE